MMQPDLGLRVSPGHSLASSMEARCGAADRQCPNKLLVVLRLEWLRRASFALLAGCRSEEEARAAWRVCGSSAPGRPWRRANEAVVHRYFIWRWCLTRWWWPSSPRPGSVVEGRPRSSWSSASCPARLGSFSSAAAAAGSVTPSGTQGCRASTPAASTLPSRLLSHYSTPSSMFPGGGAVTGARRRRR
jgi:hypothetical protein